jgi:hypothetical protein
VVHKQPREVIIQTTGQRIRGYLHLKPETRLMDTLNQQEAFLAVTNAVILDADGSDLYSSRFLTVQVSQIIWVLPVEEMISNTEES